MLATDVPDVDLVKAGFRILLDVDVNGKMCVDISHFILEAFGNADDEVVDDGFDCAKGSVALAGAVVQFDIDNVARRVGEADC